MLIYDHEIKGIITAVIRKSIYGHLVLLIFFLFVVHVAHGKVDKLSSTNILIDKSLISSIDWKDNSTLQTITKRWSVYDGNQNRKGVKIIQKHEFLIFDVHFIAELIQQKKDYSYAIFFKPAFTKVKERKVTQEQIDKLAKHIKDMLGPPLKVVDTSFGSKETFAIAHIQKEWILNNTRILLDYSAITTYNTFISAKFFLRLEDKSTSERLHDLIYLKFDGQEKNFESENEAEILPTEPFIFIIDLNSKTVLNRHKLPITIRNNIDISDDYIEAKWEDEKNQVSHNLRIDRLLGTFAWEIHIKGYEHEKKKIWGNYTKLDGIPDNKF